MVSFEGESEKKQNVENASNSETPNSRGEQKLKKG